MTTAGVAIAVYLTWLSVVVIPTGVDAHAYWAAAIDNPYRISIAGDVNAYLYSPAFLQALVPLKLLPWTVFQTLVVATMAGLIVVIWRPWSPIILLLPPVTMELANANIDILLGVTCVLALRWPAAWALPLLTKVTPGVGLTWFAVRREWRSLGSRWPRRPSSCIVSVLLGGDWAGWIGVLSRNNAAAPLDWVVPVALPSPGRGRRPAGGLGSHDEPSMDGGRRGDGGAAVAGVREHLVPCRPGAGAPAARSCRRR